MAQDLREMFKKEREVQGPQMKMGHKVRFLERLEVDLPKNAKSRWHRYRIAASVLLLFSLGFTGYYLSTSEVKVDPAVVTKTDSQKGEKGISLGDLSPDLKKVEQYYLASINLELSQLQVSESNKMLVDNFMDRLSDLNAEYKTLNNELGEIGPNDQTINALIKNLQLRLQLLQKLKSKLNEFKSSKNGQVEKNTI
ncbi:MAG: hypothetical protein AAFX53_18230 [Bacteroidota bacterium]